MSNDQRPGRRADREPPSFTRIAVWILVAAVGAYLVLSGVIGIVAKG
jgi:hypothetical protein